MTPPPAPPSANARPAQAPGWAHGLWPWVGFAVLLVVAPLAWRSGLGHTLLSQMGIAVLACLSFNLLYGQGGMLSFGHAVYTGMGSFLAIHTLNRAVDWGLPISLVPLAGGLGAAALAVVLGWVTTRRAGTPLAMISLGVGELVWAVALMFPQVFGGAAGVSGNRVGGAAPWGFTLGPQVQMYALIAVYTLAGTALLWAFTRTPLGRALNAVRDHPERVAFLGFDPHRVRHLAFVVSGFFAGVAGGLAALQLETVSAEVLSAQRSGAYLVFTVLGGSALFVGPMLGGVLMVLAFAVLSTVTQAWLLVLGVAFLAVVLGAPGGLAGWVATWPARLARSLCDWRAGGAPRTAAVRRWARGTGRLLALGVAGFGALLALELLYLRLLQAGLSTEARWLGWTLRATQPQPWLVAAALLAAGALAHRALRAVPPDSSAPPVPADGALLRPLLRPPGFEKTIANNPINTCDNAQKSIKNDAQPLAMPTVAGVPPLRQPPPAPVVLAVDGVGHRFGATVVLDGVSLQLHAGERVALIGPNGAGKSTLFDVLSGRLRPTCGRVRLHGRDLLGQPPHCIHRLGVSRSFQVGAVFARLTVAQHLQCAALGAVAQRHSPWCRLSGLQGVQRRTEDLLHALGLAHCRDRLATELTHAQQRLLELGLAVASDAPVLLLDEPTAGLSRSETAHAVALIRQLTEGKTLLMVEHDMDVVFGLADRVAVLEQGRLLAVDRPQAVRDNPQVQAAYLGQLSC